MSLYIRAHHLAAVRNAKARGHLSVARPLSAQAPRGATNTAATEQTATAEAKRVSEALSAPTKGVR